MWREHHNIGNSLNFFKKCPGRIGRRRIKPMATLLKLGMTVWIILLALPSCRAYGFEESARSTPPVPFSTSEACAPGPVVGGTRGNVEGATVSVTSLLTPQKAERAYRRAEKDFARN